MGREVRLWFSSSPSKPELMRHGEAIPGEGSILSLHWTDSEILNTTGINSCKRIFVGTSLQIKAHFVY